MPVPKRELEAEFNKIDTNGNGSITREEFLAHVKETDETHAESFTDTRMRAMDIGRDGAVDFEEFTKFKNALYLAQYVFKALDVDGNGSIDKNEIFKAMKQNIEILKKDASILLRNEEFMADGKYSYWEFVEVYISLYNQ